MSIDLKVNTAKFKREGKLYIIFVLGFILIAYFYYSTGTKAYTDITNILNNTKETEKDIKALDEKIAALKLIDPKTISQLNSLNVSFQSEDPSLFLFSQLKELSNIYNVRLDKINFTSSTPTTDILAAAITFSVIGVKENIYSFLDHVQRIAPLTGYGNMKFAGYINSGEEFTLDMSLEAFYAPLPKVLPDTRENISPLTDAEKSQYQELTGLEVLSKSDFKAEYPVEKNENPFDNPLIQPLKEGI